MLYQSNFNGYIPFSLNIICAILFFGGELLSIAGLITLGKSFGVSPSKRTYVFQGIYSYLDHPIYLGYVISEISILITNFSKINLLVFLLSTFLYCQRASFENNIQNSSV